MQMGPRKAEAQFVTKSFTTLVADVSPTGIANNVAIWGQRLKDYVLDKLAYIAAKQILHQMTVSVVNWVNSGYEGKPAFLTNPSGFFLDAADQVTGDFLAENGPLRRLCSPWSVDIRVALALQQLQTSYNGISSGRYTCTLSSVISNYRGATVNGYSIDGFLDGDFKQGGWPAFIALTTERQNNPYGSYLQAYSDQLYAIQQKKGSIAADLQQGNGFLSWQDCTDLPDYVQTGDDAREQGLVSADSSIRTKDGKLQTCKTKTPGSVISGTLMGQLDSPRMELLLADSINEIATAMITQLVSQTLQKGLYSLSGSGGTGSGRAYLQQVYRDAVAPRTVDASGVNANPDVQSLTLAKERYDQAIALLTDSKNRYSAAQACFTAKMGSASATSATVVSASSQIALINEALSTKVIPEISILSGVRNAIVSQLSNMNAGQTATLPGGSNIDVLARSIESQTSNYYGNFAAFTLAGQDLQTVVEKSGQDLAAAQEDAARYNTDAYSFETFCNNM